MYDPLQKKKKLAGRGLQKVYGENDCLCLVVAWEAEVGE